MPRRYVHLRFWHLAIVSWQISVSSCHFIVAYHYKWRWDVWDQMRMGQLRIALWDVFRSQERVGSPSDTTLDDQPSRNFIRVSCSCLLHTIINFTRSRSSIANAYDFRVLDLLIDNMVWLLQLNVFAPLVSNIVLVRWGFLIGMWVPPPISSATILLNCINCRTSEGSAGFFTLSNSGMIPCTFVPKWLPCNLTPTLTLQILLSVSNKVIIILSHTTQRSVRFRSVHRAQISHPTTAHPATQCQGWDQRLSCAESLTSS
jgi:hypothetical protein